MGVVRHICVPAMAKQIEFAGIAAVAVSGLTLEVIQPGMWRIDDPIAELACPEAKVDVAEIRSKPFVEPTQLAPYTLAERNAGAADGRVVADDVREAVIPEKIA